MTGTSANTLIFTEIFGCKKENKTGQALQSNGNKWQYELSLYQYSWTSLSPLMKLARRSSIHSRFCEYISHWHYICLHFLFGILSFCVTPVYSIVNLKLCLLSLLIEVTHATKTFSCNILIWSWRSCSFSLLAVIHFSSNCIISFCGRVVYGVCRPLAVACIWLLMI